MRAAALALHQQGSSRHEIEMRIEEWRNAAFDSLYANCWHFNNGESEAMWNMYNREHLTLAVRTTVSELQEALTPTSRNYMLGLVRYEPEENINCDVWAEAIRWSFTKRRAFEHEHEYRVLYLADGIMPTGNTIVRSMPLEQIIHEVVLSPWANASHVDAVEHLCLRYGLIHRVRRSTLLDPPPSPFLGTGITS